MHFKDFQRKLPITYLEEGKGWTAHLPTIKIATVAKIPPGNFLITFENISTEAITVGSIVAADQQIRLITARFFVACLHTVKEDGATDSS